jgi:peptide/nickel transport system substrate-binding protein
MLRGPWEVVAGLLLLTFVALLTQPAAQTRRELRVGVHGLPAQIDPASAVAGAVPLVARQVFETLVTYGPNSTDVQPSLATRWNVSRDGLTWSFTLRDGVRFHDGTSVTAGDVAASFTRQLSAEGGGAAGRPVWSALLRGAPGVVRAVRASDARTVQFVLAQPYAVLLTVLAHPGFGVVKLVGEPEGSARLLGTGPYRISETAPGRIALEAQPGHWAFTPRVDRVVFVDVATDERAEADLDAGALDVWFPPRPPRRTEGALSAPGPRVGYLAFQTEREPFSRKKVRQAVATGIEPAALSAALDRVAIPLQSFLPPGVWARREGSPILAGHRQAAKKLLVEGGWPRGQRATLGVVPGDGALDVQRIAEAVVAALGAIDIPVQVRGEPAEGPRPRLPSGDVSMVMAEAAVLGGDPHLLLYPLSTSEVRKRSPRAETYSITRQASLDDVLIRASQLSFRPERQRLYQRAQAMLAEELPWIPVYVRLEWAVVRPEVRGLRLHPSGFHRLDTVSLEGGAEGSR